jgi:hypothetical protein
MKLILEAADKLDWVDLDYCIKKLKAKLAEIHPRVPREKGPRK